MWNQERQEIALLAMKNIIFPSMVKSTKEKLVQNAIDFVASQCQVALMKVHFNMS
jgi:hypothetical protein